MLLTTYCDENDCWFGKVQDDAYSETGGYLCSSLELIAPENCIFIPTFPSEQEVIDTFIQYNKRIEKEKQREKAIRLSAKQYVWDKGELRKI